MTDEENVGVIEQQTQEAIAQATDSEQAHDDRQEQTPQASKAKDAAYNWAEARRKMQELERERDFYREEALKRQQQASPQPKSEEDELSKLSPDDILTVAQAQKLAERQARKVAEQLLKEREAETVDERLQLKYPDYREVLSSENIEYLKQNEPELAMSLQSLAHDPYAQSVAAYKLLKKIGIQNQATPEKKKAIENSQKPLSVQAVPRGTSPLGNAHMFENGLTPELKQALWKEMEDAKRRM